LGFTVFGRLFRGCLSPQVQLNSANPKAVYQETEVSFDKRVLDVIQTIYDAAVDDTRWPEALKQLCDFTDSQAATFWVLDGSEEPRLPTFTYVNLDPAFVQEYLDKITPMDPWNRYLVGHPNQPIVHDGLVITEREKDLHPYFDWHGRYSDTRFRLIGRVSPAPALHAGVALHRTRKAGRYESEDIDRFAVIYPHLERALGIGSRLGSLAALHQCTIEVLDRHTAAIVFLDERKCMVYANRNAEALRSNGDGVQLSATGITLARGDDHRRMQRLIDGALTSMHVSGAAPGGIMLVQRPSGKRPYLLLVAPVSQRYPVLATSRPAVCLMLSDPESKKPPASSHLRAGFGLTEAEARLAVLLAAGENLRSIAEKLGITYGTARTRLAIVFQKTDTRRQAELVKLLLSTLALPEELRI
jgi:DNA-binding CsgD family transcriptional regulator